MRLKIIRCCSSTGNSILRWLLFSNFLNHWFPWEHSSFKGWMLYLQIIVKVLNHHENLRWYFCKNVYLHTYVECFCTKTPENFGEIWTKQILVLRTFTFLSTFSKSISDYFEIWIQKLIVTFLLIDMLSRLVGWVLL